MMNRSLFTRGTRTNKHHNVRVKSFFVSFPFRHSNRTTTFETFHHDVCLQASPSLVPMDDGLVGLFRSASVVDEKNLEQSLCGRGAAGNPNQDQNQGGDANETKGRHPKERKGGRSCVSS